MTAYEKGPLRWHVDDLEIGLRAAEKSAKEFEVFWGIGRVMVRPIKFKLSPRDSRQIYSVLVLRPPHKRNHTLTPEKKP